MTRRSGVEPWDTEWAGHKAAEALRYLGRNFPECLENLRVLDEPEEAAHEAAMAGDRDAYLEALRSYCRAGRDEALRILRKAKVCALDRLLLERFSFHNCGTAYGCRAGATISPRGNFLPAEKICPVPHRIHPGQ